MQPDFEQAVQRVWRRRGLWACLLWPVSQCYRVLLALRRFLYLCGVFQTHCVPVPVLVVGNVIAGGAGKTPVVMALVQYLQSRGLQPGVISRGYGRSTVDCREVQVNSLADEVGDEALLLHHHCQVPVFVAARRIEAARALLAQHAQTDVLVCDDGLQHLALHRDIDICVFDERGVGNGWLLPAGPLREPWPRPVDLVLHTGATVAFAGFRARRVLDTLALRSDGSRLALDELRGRPLVAVAGIAHPENFFQMLRAMGLTLTQTVALPDHYSFAGWRVTLPQSGLLLCTEKDAVKLWHSHPEALAVPLSLEFEAAFLQALEALLAPSLGAKLSSDQHSPGELKNNGQ